MNELKIDLSAVAGNELIRAHAEELLEKGILVGFVEDFDFLAQLNGVTKTVSAKGTVLQLVTEEDRQLFIDEVIDCHLYGDPTPYQECNNHITVL